MKNSYFQGLMNYYHAMKIVFHDVKMNCQAMKMLMFNAWKIKIEDMTRIPF